MPVQTEILFSCILTAVETQPTLVVPATVFLLLSQAASNTTLWLQDALFAFGSGVAVCATRDIIQNTGEVLE